MTDAIVISAAWGLTHCLDRWAVLLIWCYTKYPSVLRFSTVFYWIITSQVIVSKYSVIFSQSHARRKCLYITCNISRSHARMKCLYVTCKISWSCASDSENKWVYLIVASITGVTPFPSKQRWMRDWKLFRVQFHPWTIRSTLGNTLEVLTQTSYLAFLYSKDVWVILLVSVSILIPLWDNELLDYF